MRSIPVDFQVLLELFKEEDKLKNELEEIGKREKEIRERLAEVTAAIPKPSKQSSGENVGSVGDFHRIANEIANEVSRKNHDYGNSYFLLRDAWGEQSFAIRVGDKYHRLANLLKGNKAQVDESIEDTIRDIVGYCLLELAYRKRNGSN